LTTPSRRAARLRASGCARQGAGGWQAGCAPNTPSLTLADRVAIVPDPPALLVGMNHAFEEECGIELKRSRQHGRRTQPPPRRRVTLSLISPVDQPSPRRPSSRSEVAGLVLDDRAPPRGASWAVVADGDRLCWAGKPPAQKQSREGLFASSLSERCSCYPPRTAAEATGGNDLSYRDR
jgi:hypothetical protein